MTARLPTPGVDRTGWGTTLNEFLGVAHNSDGTLKSIGAAIGGFVSVKDPAYGAVGDGVSDDTAEIQAAVDALSIGGRLWFPPGNYKISGPITIAKPCVVEGAAATAANLSYGSRVTNSSGSTDAFVVTSDHVRFRDLSIGTSVAAGSVTASRAIYINGGNYCAVERCRIAGHYNGIEINAGYGWYINYNYIVNNKNYSVFIKDVGSEDAGDQTMVGNQFDADMSSWIPAAHVRYESGGGAKIVGNKFTHADRAVDLAVEDGAATSILVFTDNSIELQAVSCIRVARKGTTGTFKRVLINSNQFTGSSCSSDVIEVGASGISETMIANNLIFGNASIAGIHIRGGDNNTITGNSLTTLLQGILLESAHTNSYIRGNKFQSCSTFIIDQSTGAASTSPIEWDFTRTFTNVTSTATATNLFRVEVKDRQGIDLTVSFHGTVNSGISGFAAHVARVGSRNSSGANVTLVTVGTDTQAGGPIQFAFDTTTTAGVIFIGVFRNAGDGGTSINGIANLKVTGGVNRVLPV